MPQALNWLGEIKKKRVADVIGRADKLPVYAPARTCASRLVRKWI